MYPTANKIQEHLKVKGLRNRNYVKGMIGVGKTYRIESVSQNKRYKVARELNKFAYKMRDLIYETKEDIFLEVFLDEILK